NCPDRSALRERAAALVRRDGEGRLVLDGGARPRRTRGDAVRQRRLGDRGRARFHLPARAPPALPRRRRDRPPPAPPGARLPGAPKVRRPPRAYRLPPFLADPPPPPEPGADHAPRASGFPLPHLPLQRVLGHPRCLDLRRPARSAAVDPLAWDRPPRPA